MSRGSPTTPDVAEALLAHDDRFVVALEPDDVARVEFCGPGLTDCLDVGDVEGKPLGRAFGDRFGADLAERCRQCRDSGETVRFREDGAGDTVYEVELSPAFADEPRTLVVASVTDVTEREQLREELDRTSDLFDAILDNVPIHLYVKDRDARHLAVSDFYVDQLPFLSDRSDAIGATDVEMLPGEMGTDSLADDRRVIEENEPMLKKETYVPMTDMWTLTSKIPWEDDGEVRGIVGATIDITRRKQYAQKLERKTEQLAEFASIITHDLLNPLSLGQGHLEAARESGSDEHFDQVEDALDRAVEITRGLERLVRASGEVDPDGTVDLEDVAREAWRQAGTDAGTLSFDGRLAVDADANWLQTLFENLFRNSVEHAGGDVRVELGDLEDAEGFYVADDGPGIPEHRRDEVFESGETTRDDGGMGLWIVARIVDAHGWEISVTEGQTGGARFEVTTDSAE